MPSREQRILTTAINRLFRAFSVDFEYSLTTTQPDDSGWGDDQEAPPEWVAVHEPLIAVGNSANSMDADEIVRLDGGQAEDYAMEWISHLDLPVDTQVRYDGCDLRIAKPGGYAEHAGAYLYFLKGRSDHNRVSS